MKPNYKNCIFVKSAAALKDCPDSLGEIAFVGRSNSGKSSAINYLTNTKIARTSKTPGRTQLINFFSIGHEQIFLVDLPGYGYAKVAKNIKYKWDIFLNDYIQRRDALQGIVIVMDCRHPMQDTDITMLDYCKDVGLHVHIILTKADKLSRNIQKSALLQVKNLLAKDWDFATIQLFSSTKRDGEIELCEVLNSWFADIDVTPVAPTDIVDTDVAINSAD